MEQVQQSHNVVQRVCEATKHRMNPLLPLGRADEWDGRQASPWAMRTVLYDEEEKLFKCWYNGTDLTDQQSWASGYAVSSDGIHWTKPHLGLIEYNGSKDNNIVFAGWGSVLKDDHEPNESRRYKAMLMGPVPKNDYGIRLAYSPDGIHWHEQEPFKIPDWRGRNPDIVAFIKDEQESNPDRRFKLIWQDTHQSKKPGPDAVRIKSIAFSPDGQHFTGSSDNPILDPNDGPEVENHFVMIAPYEGYWIMPYEAAWYTPNDLGLYGQYMGDVRLAVSTDGEHFNRVNPFEILIRRGSHGQWDDCFLVASDKPIVKGNTIYLFYCGQGQDWSYWPAQNISPNAETAGVGSRCMSRMGLATLPLDRWTCLETQDREIPGTLTTNPIEIMDPNIELFLNVSSLHQNSSFIRVEVLDGTSGQVIEGFDRHSCERIEQDAIRRHVRWKGKTLSDLRCGKYQFCVELCGAARIHSYSLS